MTEAASFIAGGDFTLVVTSTGGTLTGSTEVTFTLSKGKTAPTFKFQKTMSGGQISIVSATRMDITLDSADTINLSPGKYEIQGLQTNASGKLKPVKFSPTYIVVEAAAPTS